MTLEQFLENYNWNACITIENAEGKKLCEEAYFYDWDNDECVLGKEPWWNEYKDCEIKLWNVIGGGCYPIEICVDLRPINWDGWERNSEGRIILKGNNDD